MYFLIQVYISDLFKINVINYFYELQKYNIKKLKMIIDN